MAKKPQFSVVPESVWFDERITSPYPKLIYSAIQFHANGIEGDAWPSHDRIAAMCSMSRDSVKRHVKTLIDLGYVAKISRAGTSNLYRVMLSAPGAESPTQVVLSAPGGGAESTTNKNQGTKNHENNSSVSPSVPEGEFQAETSDPVSLVTEMLDAVEIEEPPVAPDPEQRIVGRSGLTQAQAREKFSVDNFDPAKAARESESLKKTLGLNGDTPDHSSVTVPSQFGQAVNGDKMKALGRARTPHPIKFPPTFNPMVVGYTESMFKAEFSLLDYQATLGGFVAHHMSKGDTSENWLGKFLTYSQVGQSEAAERARESGTNEPPANKAVGWDAKRKQMFKEQANPGEGYAAWQMRMRAEGVELP